MSHHTDAVDHFLDMVIMFGPEVAPLSKIRRYSAPPMKIAMMLHFATVIGPYAPESARTSPAYTKFVKELLRDGLIERPSNAERASYRGWAYRATDKGQAYVEALKAVQLPVAETKWTVPA
jgi:hypothetical protein